MRNENDGIKKQDNDPQPIESYQERIDRLTWFITTLDNRRSSLEARSATVLSADALLFAGVLFLAQGINGFLELKIWARIILGVDLIAVVILLAISIANATSAIANVSKSSKTMYGMNTPVRLFFYPRETFEKYQNFDAYSKGFVNMPDADFVQNLLGELWVISREYHMRYQKLRWAIRFLLYSIVPFLLLIGYSIVSNLM